MNPSLPPIQVYFGIIDRVDGPTSAQGCQTLLFSGRAWASWNPVEMILFDNMKPADRSLPSCDVVVNAAQVGDFCELWIGPDRKQNLFLKTAQLPAIECV